MNNTQHIFDHPSLGPVPITKIYYGGDRVCRCGCAGEYFTPEDDSFDQKCKRFLRLAKDYDFQQPDAHDLGSNYANITTGKSGTFGTALCAYFD